MLIQEIIDMGMRRKGREIALQTLYSLGFVETDPFLGDLELIQKYEEKLIEIAHDTDVKEDSQIFKFADNLVKNVLKNMEDVDEQIKSHTTNWPFDRIALLDKSILRIAGYEIIFTNTAAPIIMNEAIEIAKKFCSESSGKFVNGILNSIAADKKEGKLPAAEDKEENE